MRWRRLARSDVNVKHRYARTGQQLASGAIDCVLPCLADAPAEIFKIGDAAAQCPERCVELFDPYENPQQRPGQRHLVILDAAARMGEMVHGRTARTVPLSIVTIRHLTPPAEFCGRA
jgi:hypothetical protein